MASRDLRRNNNNHITHINQGIPHTGQRARSRWTRVPDTQIPTTEGPYKPTEHHRMEGVRLDQTTVREAMVRAEENRRTGIQYSGNLAGSF